MKRKALREANATRNKLEQEELSVIYARVFGTADGIRVYEDIWHHSAHPHTNERELNETTLVYKSGKQAVPTYIENMIQKGTETK